MSIATHDDPVNSLLVLWDDEQATPAMRYTIWIEERDLVVIAQTSESPAVVWLRVLNELKEARDMLRREAMRGSRVNRYGNHATVFAGIQPTEEQTRERHRALICACLLEIAETAKDSTSRVRAAVMASELLGMGPPRTGNVTPFTYEQIKAEADRRRANHHRPRTG